MLKRFLRTRAKAVPVLLVPDATRRWLVTAWCSWSIESRRTWTTFSWSNSVFKVPLDAFTWSGLWTTTSGSTSSSAAKGMTVQDMVTKRILLCFSHPVLFLWKRTSERRVRQALCWRSVRKRAGMARERPTCTWYGTRPPPQTEERQGLQIWQVRSLHESVHWASEPSPVCELVDGIDSQNIKVVWHRWTMTLVSTCWLSRSLTAGHALAYWPGSSWQSCSPQVSISYGHPGRLSHLRAKLVVIDRY